MASFHEGIVGLSFSGWKVFEFDDYDVDGGGLLLIAACDADDAENYALDAGLGYWILVGEIKELEAVDNGGLEPYVIRSFTYAE